MEDFSAHNIFNMVAERRLTAMMLQEAAARLTGLESSPSSTRSLERWELNAQKELMVGDPVLPYWGSSGKLGGA